MKTITKITMTRISNTRSLIDQLPVVFTRKEYDALRQAQIDQLMKDAPYRSWRNKICREDSAFTLANLREEGFLIVVRSEPVTIEVEEWNYMARTYEKKPLEVERHYYRFSEEIEDFFAKTLDNWEQM
jgi:hypothetical protein